VLKQILHGTQPSKMTTRFLLVAPSATFLGVLAIDFVLILASPETRSSLKPDVSGLYCDSKNSTMVFIAAGACIPVLLMWFFVYIKTTLLLRQHKYKFAACDGIVRTRISSIFIRTSLMTFAACVGLILVIRDAVVPATEEKPYNIFQYLVFSLLIFTIFGTQSEFLRCWMCRRPAKPPQRRADRTGITSM